MEGAGGYWSPQRDRKHWQYALLVILQLELKSKPQKNAHLNYAVAHTKSPNFRMRILCSQNVLLVKPSKVVGMEGLASITGILD